MKLSDYLVDYLAKEGIGHIFVVTGGACSHIIDSIGKRHDLKYICFQHEQGAAMAADAYSRLGGKLGVAVATSGPGATNLITGVCCSWFDSIPVLMLSGQVNLEETKGRKKIRQLGFQETAIVDIVKPITKFAALVKNPNQIKNHLSKALYIARNGRPGPVWLDIPLDVQNAKIDPLKLKGFEEETLLKGENKLLLRKQVKKCLEFASSAKRPVILAGFGIRIDDAVGQFRKLVEALGWPVVASWSATDILPYNHSQYIGQIGVYGSRAANFTIQNSDLVLAIGSRLDSRQTGSQPRSFAREAVKIVVDVDKGELAKGWVIPDLAINFGAKDFLEEINKHFKQYRETRRAETREWLKKACQWKGKYPNVLKSYWKQKKFVNPYIFVKTLSDQSDNEEIIFTDTGANMVITMQSFEVKGRQRLISAFGNSPMGYSVPAAIGAWFATKKKRIICLIGDGGMQVNLQELETIVNYKVPVKIFILNNKSYGLIKQFQDIYFEGNYQATTKESGYSSPDFLKIAKAYSIETAKIDSHKNMARKIKEILNKEGALVCEVSISQNQKVAPKLAAEKTADGRYISRPIEDQMPYLGREEFRQNMLVKPVKSNYK